MNIHLYWWYLPVLLFLLPLGLSWYIAKTRAFDGPMATLYLGIIIVIAWCFAIGILLGHWL